MKLPDLTEQLDDAELDELHEFLLARPEDSGLLLDGAHGLVTAVAIGPELVSPSEWLPLILGSEDAFASVAEAERIINLIMRLYNSVLAEVGAMAYEPILGEIDDEQGGTELTAHGWCEGFSQGAALRAEAWEVRLAEDTELVELLSPIVALSLAEGVVEPEADMEVPELSQEDYRECMNQLGGSVIELQNYWRSHPTDAPTGTGTDDPDANPDPAPPRRRGGLSVH